VEGCHHVPGAWPLIVKALHIPSANQQAFHPDSIQKMNNSCWFLDKHKNDSYGRIPDKDSIKFYRPFLLALRLSVVICKLKYLVSIQSPPFQPCGVRHQKSPPYIRPGSFSQRLHFFDFSLIM